MCIAANKAYCYFKRAALLTRKSLIPKRTAYCGIKWKKRTTPTPNWWHLLYFNDFDWWKCKDLRVWWLAVRLDCAHNSKICSKYEINQFQQKHIAFYLVQVQPQRGHNSRSNVALSEDSLKFLLSLNWQKRSSGLHQLVLYRICTLIEVLTWLLSCA